MSSPSTYVLLHGFTGDPRSFDDLARALPPGARLLRPTLPGHGDPAAEVLAWDAQIAALADALRDEGVREAHLVGYSFGGRLGWGLLQHPSAPRLFTRATLVGAHPGLGTAAERDARREADLRWIDLLRERGLPAFVEAWEVLPLWDTQRSLPSATLERQRRIRRSHQAAGLADALARLGLGRMPPAAIESIEVPVHLVVGERDHKHQALARATGLSLSVVRGVGHNVLLEDPRRLAALISPAASSHTSPGVP